MLQPVRHRHISNLKSIPQLENSMSTVELYTSDLEKLTKIILDCSEYARLPAPKSKIL